ncbi:MAG: HAD-IA family hydrolase [Gammaproteobacteria bacterium]|nr:HAD-IA family hydrolase [Gammaproteobacteria bacterium]
MLKAIIFDMDGTLADTEGIHRLAFNQAFSEFELDWFWSVEEYKQQLSVSGGKERIRLNLEQLQTSVMNTDEIWQLTLAVHKRKSDIYRDMLVAGDIQLRRGVKRLLDDAMKNDITLAIATSSCFSNVKTLLQNALGEDALELFSVIVTSDLVTEKKPSPAVYDFALRELGLPAENCIALEDTSNGNRAALAANLKTIITTHIYTNDDDFSGASLVLGHLGDQNAPFTVKAGNAYDKDLVDVELLRLICS